MLTRPLVRPVHYETWGDLSAFIHRLRLQGDLDRAEADVARSAYLFSGLEPDQLAELVGLARNLDIHVFTSPAGNLHSARALVLGTPEALGRLADQAATCRGRVQCIIRLLQRRETPRPTAWVLPSGPLPLDRPIVQAIINVTPDSFFDGGKYNTTDRAVARAEQAVEQGADIIDVGGESTRPGANPVSSEEEMRRVLPVITELTRRLPVPVSVDSYKADVAERALDAGAQIVNDVTALRGDPAMLGVIARARASVIIMHMRGTPRTMQRMTQYESLMGEIVELLADRIEVATRAGIPRERIAVDPGIGFGKAPGDNLVILKCLSVLTELGCPVLVGASRKSFLGHTFGWPKEERLEGSLAAAAAAVLGGASIVRVHDVKETRRVVDTVWAIHRAGTGEHIPQEGRDDVG